MQNNKTIQVDLRNCNNYECSCCGSVFFTKEIIIKIIPGIIIGSTKNELMPIEIIRCKNCGEIPEQYKEMLENPKN
ncbi:MAG: hypothetical protein N3F62_00170 [Bacteroidia bacterium]|nr:hypothetical protein [Bacteroidia bacterium]